MALLETPASPEPNGAPEAPHDPATDAQPAAVATQPYGPANPLDVLRLEKEDSAASGKARERLPALTALAGFERRLRAATRWTPVTFIVVAANAVVFALMAFAQHRVLRFRLDALLSWGAAHAPRAFGGDWWRTVTATFVHGDLDHLAGNLLFLLLLAPLTERLLGSVRFAVVYVAAGVGGVLLGMAWSPHAIAVGASGSVYGVYGAFLGCCLRGPRSIPWSIFGQRVGLLLLFTGLTCLMDWLDVRSTLVPHAAGFLFGLAGGLVYGHVLRERGRLRRAGNLVAGTVLVVGFVGLTGWWVKSLTVRAVSFSSGYAAAQDRERQLLARFDDALRRWEDGADSDVRLKEVLEKQLIPDWEKARAQFNLGLSTEMAPFEQRRFSLHDFTALVRSARGQREARPKEALSVEEYGKMYRLYFKLRLDNWRAFAEELGNKDPMPEEALMDHLGLEVLRHGLDEMTDDDNPLRRWLDSSRTRRRERRR